MSAEPARLAVPHWPLLLTGRSEQRGAALAGVAFPEQTPRPERVPADLADLGVTVTVTAGLGGTAAA
ncbi:hypothetical protein [Kitasatospora sp. NPDC086791]|uniref:hypothetical protein n=1 Tax=Kitasatospora sp. NPDC086791 TaxID=3155178 RepID=UPI0034210FEF